MLVNYQLNLVRYLTFRRRAAHAFNFIKAPHASVKKRLGGGKKIGGSSGLINNIMGSRLCACQEFNELNMKLVKGGNSFQYKKKRPTGRFLDY
jgi:hypothetical protein